jgi:hypothetical protein
VRISAGGLRILKKLDGPVLEAHRRQFGHMKRPELRQMIALLEKARHRDGRIQRLTSSPNKESKNL